MAAHLTFLAAGACLAVIAGFLIWWFLCRVPKPASDFYATHAVEANKDAPPCVHGVCGLPGNSSPSPSTQQLDAEVAKGLHLEPGDAIPGVFTLDAAKLEKVVGEFPSTLVLFHERADSGYLFGTFARASSRQDPRTMFYHVTDPPVETRAKFNVQKLPAMLHFQGHATKNAVVPLFNSKEELLRALQK